MTATLTRSETTTARIRAGRRFARSVAAEIVRRFDPERVILFGSYAYGTPNRDSDVDLMVVCRSGERPLDLAVRMDANISNRLLPIDLMAITPTQMRRRLAGFDPFLEEVLKRGIVLHARHG